MATQDFTQPALIAQKPQAETIEFVLSDGVHFDEAIGEHIVVVGGQIVNYAFHWSTGVAQFKEALRVRREHYAINPAEMQKSIRCPSCGGGMDERQKYYICIDCGYVLWK